MFSLTAIVWTVIFVLGAAAIFAILWFVINYLQREIGGPVILYKGLRIFLVIVAALFAIFLILYLITGVPIVIGINLIG